MTRTVTVCIALVCASLVLAACGRKKRKRRARKSLLTVHVQKVASQVLPRTIVASGRTQPVRELVISTQVQGAVAQLNVALGQKVKEKDLLVRVSTVGLWAQAQQAKARIKQFDTDLVHAERELRDTKKLFEQKIATRKQVDDANYKLATLKTQKSQAKASLAQIWSSFQGGAVYAPFAGVIAEKRVEVGDYVAPGKVVGRLVDLSEVKVTVGVAEIDMVRLTKSTPVKVGFPALGGVERSARISAIAPTADPQTGAYPVELRVANPRGDLRGGMTARVKFEQPGLRGVFLPVEAVVERGGKRVVYILAAKAPKTTVKRRVVSVGAARDGLLQIRKGLDEGEWVVVSGNTRLRDGSKVRVAGERGAMSAEQAKAPTTGGGAGRPPAGGASTVTGQGGGSTQGGSAAQ